MLQQQEGKVVNEVLRAEVSIAGIAIDFGTSDQHKYTRGGWESGWKALGSEKSDISSARTKPGKSVLNFWFREIPKEVVMRVRSPDGDSAINLAFGKTSLAKGLAVTSEYQVLRIPIPDGTVKTGRRKLKLSSKASLEFDWVWLPTTDNPGEFSNLPRTLPIRFENGSRRALAAPSSRTFSFYLHVPTDGKLIVDLGSDQDTTFEVSATTTSKTEILYSHKGKSENWKEAAIDLSAFSGQPIILHLRTESKMGKTGWGEPEVMIPKAKEAPPPGKRAKNLVYVVMDTTRADSFASVNPDADVATPAYDALALKSTTFRNAYNNENWTKPSVTTMWSGLYPGTHNARQATSKVDKDIRFLPQQLQDAGFTTGAFIANAVVSGTFGFDKGWTHFQNDSDHSLNGNGSKIYPHATEWMEKHKDEQFFLYVQSVDPHTTYKVPEEYSKPYYPGKYRGKIGSSFDREEQMVVDNGKLKISDDDLNWIWALYKGEVSYQDHYLGGLLRKIEELGLSENTLVVVTNDHGEEIRDHGAMGHGWPLYEEQIRAPLLMSYPPVFSPGANIEEIVEHVDLAPTILDALGVSPMKDADGLSFLPLLEDGIGKRQHPFYTLAWSRKSLRSVRVGDYKLIVGKSSGWMKLFNLASDPGEKKNLLKKQLDQAALLSGRLCEIYLSEALATPNKAARMDSAGQKQRFDNNEIPIDDKTRRELEALGYL
ncbi:MAG: sulfatase [Kofleriaceae bacterium]|nr:sulfatase [Kofleriaceae bacterium]